MSGSQASQIHHISRDHYLRRRTDCAKVWHSRVIINIIRRMLEKNPKQWHEKLSETLWAYRTSKRDATGMTLYTLTYGHDAILPMEITVQSLRIAQQHNLVGEDYAQTMLLELEGLDTSRIDTLNKLLVGK
ncbi:unnamed protein product [Prunus brigantina]